MSETTFEEISAADFFYRNRDIAGFTNPARAVFSSIRELIENSLDAAEQVGMLPDIYIRLSYEDEEKFESELAAEKKVDEKEEEEAEVFESGVYRLRIEDNGSGVPARHIPAAFGQVLFGSKYKLKQSRGTFGLGGTMSLLYGQITTHKPAMIISSTGKAHVYVYKIMVDIQRNRP